MGDFLVGSIPTNAHKNFGPTLNFIFGLCRQNGQFLHGLTLNLQKFGSARLSIGFENQTPADYILMVLAYYDQIIEITKDREIVFV